MSKQDTNTYVLPIVVVGIAAVLFLYEYIPFQTSPPVDLSSGALPGAGYCLHFPGLLAKKSGGSLVVGLYWNSLDIIHACFFVVPDCIAGTEDEKTEIRGERFEVGFG